MIGATALPKNETANAKSINIGTSINMNDAEVITIDANDLKVGFGVEATAQTATAKKVAKKESTRPKAVGYKVYCNGEVKAQQSERTYKEVLKTNGEFDYFVTSVFENGWESPASKVVVVDNPIVQASPAPYSLKGNLGDNGTLNRCRHGTRFNRLWHS